MRMKQQSVVKLFAMFIFRFSKNILSSKKYSQTNFEKVSKLWCYANTIAVMGFIIRKLNSLNAKSR